MRILLASFLALGVYAQSPAAGPDPAFLARLLERHRPQTPAGFDFAAIGDQQYNPDGERRWPALQSSINRSGVSFVVHAGDVKSGSTLCDDAMFADRVRAFNLFEMPMMITPGDNEWTDCHRENNGSFDSLERLEHLRRMFYPNNQSFGRRKLALTQQSEDPRYRKYVENSMWHQGNVLFAMLHVVGSNNNLGRNAANDAEWAERTAANFNWLKTVFAVARDNAFAGVVITMQVNPGWEGARRNVFQLDSGTWPTMYVLEDETIVFGKPVLVIIGDSHQYRIGKPLLSRTGGLLVDNLTSLEVPGSGDVHWVRVRVDPAQPELFWIAHQNVPENMRAPGRPQLPERSTSENR